MCIFLSWLNLKALLLYAVWCSFYKTLNKTTTNSNSSICCPLLFGSRLTKDGSTKVAKVNTRISRSSRVSWTKGLWRQLGIPMTSASHVYCAVARCFLSGCETWSFLTQDAYRLGIFNHRILLSIVRTVWDDRVSSDDIRNQVLGIGSESTRSQHIQFSRIRWTTGHNRLSRYWFLGC